MQNYEHDCIYRENSIYFLACGQSQCSREKVTSQTPPQLRDNRRGGPRPPSIQRPMVARAVGGTSEYSLLFAGFVYHVVISRERTPPVGGRRIILWTADREELTLNHGGEWKPVTDTEAAAAAAPSLLCVWVCVRWQDSDEQFEFSPVQNLKFVCCGDIDVTRSVWAVITVWIHVTIVSAWW